MAQQRRPSANAPAVLQRTAQTRQDGPFRRRNSVRRFSDTGFVRQDRRHAAALAVTASISRRGYMAGVPDNRRCLLAQQYTIDAANIRGARIRVFYLLTPQRRVQPRSCMTKRFCSTGASIWAQNTTTSSGLPWRGGGTSPECKPTFIWLSRRGFQCAGDKIADADPVRSPLLQFSPIFDKAGGKSSNSGARQLCLVIVTSQGWPTSVIDHLCL